MCSLPAWGCVFGFGLGIGLGGVAYPGALWGLREAQGAPQRRLETAINRLASGSTVRDA